jgi:hypothetical protein
MIKPSALESVPKIFMISQLFMIRATSFPRKLEAI